MHHQAPDRQDLRYLVQAIRPTWKAACCAKVLGMCSKSFAHNAGWDCGGGGVFCKGPPEALYTFQVCRNSKHSQVHCGASKLISGLQRLAGKGEWVGRVFSGWRDNRNVTEWYIRVITNLLACMAWTIRVSHNVNSTGFAQCLSGDTRPLIMPNAPL